jgi:hypothetical protein
MKISIISALFAVCTIAASANAQTLSPADRYDIRSAAEWAVRDMTMKAGEPVAEQGGYMVPVVVANTKCKALVKPYTPKSDQEPPLRWKVVSAVCGN